MRVLNSATAALEVALQLCGIGPGDEVITPSQTFFAAPNMIAKVGATPVFVDVELISRNLDFDAVERAITPRTRAIMPTHFAGLPVDMDRLYALAERHGLRVIEDAALAIGSSWRGRRIGGFGDLTVFSFHPNKNMTAIEGGALVLNDEAEAREVEALRFHGITRWPDGTRDVTFPGGKFNLPDVNARIGLGQLARLEEFNARRRERVADYFQMLRTDPPVCCRIRVIRATKPGTVGTCSRRYCRWTGCASIASSFARLWRRAASGRASPTKRRISPRCSAAVAIAKGNCRIPSESPAKR